MREIGVFKWFDIEKGYGFISRIEEFEDLYVHQSQLRCSELSINEGVYVTYEIIEKKKRQAGEIKLLRDDDSSEVIKKAFLSERNGIWQYGFKKYVPTIKNPDEYIINLIISKLEINPNSSALIDYIPEYLFLYTQKLQRYLTPLKKLKLLISLLNNPKELKNRNANLTELRTTLLKSASQNNKYWDLVPDNLLLESSIIDIAPKERIFNYYIQELKKGRNTRVTAKKFIQFIKGHSEFAKQIPETLLKNHEELFTLLLPEKQVEIVWNDLDTKWNKLSVAARIMAIYRSAKENNKIHLIINKLKNYQEKNQLVRAYLLILSSKKHKDGFGFNPFIKAHEMIQEYFINSKVYPKGELSYILPICNHNVTFLCEGRKWFDSRGNDFKNQKIDSFGNEIAFCPRKANSCIVGELGARLYSNTIKHWSYWTLAELLEECGLEPNLPELQENDVYTMKLNGWVNRLLEIKERMKCSKCNEIMIADYKYAKNLAVYNTTVTRCRHGHESVYLTHCWACHKIIDSRESQHKFGDYYLCIHCGSGPKNNMKTSYRQGDICPKCYSNNMDDIGNRIKGCSTCNHKIRLPIDKYLTGLTDQYIKKKGEGRE